MSTRFMSFVAMLFVLTLVVGCRAATPTITPVMPTPTIAAATATPVPPTVTPLPPAATPIPEPSLIATLTPISSPIPLAARGDLAYCYQPDNDLHQIYLINLDGSGSRKLITATIGLNHLDWSSDGRKIAAVGYMDRSFTTWSIHVLDADGSHLVRLTSQTGAADSEPAWSPDGTHIVFSRIHFTGGTSYSSQTWAMNADGSDQHLVLADGLAAKWSPDGKRLIYTSNKSGNYEIYTANVDGTDEQRLTNTPADESSPVWSPDGRRILFAASAGAWNSPESIKTYEIFVMNADGSGRQQLTANQAYDASPRWSPDGTQIVFGSDRAEVDHYEVYVMNADGTNVRQVTHTPAGVTAINPVWHP